MRNMLVMGSLLLAVGAAGAASSYVWLSGPVPASAPATETATSAAPPDGPTAEELVAFMFAGLEDGKPMPVGPSRRPDDPLVKQESASPAVYMLPMGGKALRFSITKMDQCTYRTSMKLEGEDAKEGLFLDFSRPNIHLVVENGRPYLNGFVCNGGECTGGDRLDAGDEEKLAKTYVYFRETFCPEAQANTQVGTPVAQVAAQRSTPLTDTEMKQLVLSLHVPGTQCVNDRGDVLISCTVGNHVGKVATYVQNSSKNVIRVDGEVSSSSNLNSFFDYFRQVVGKLGLTGGPYEQCALVGNTRVFKSFKLDGYDLECSSYDNGQRFHYEMQFTRQ